LKVHHILTKITNMSWRSLVAEKLTHHNKPGELSCLFLDALKLNSIFLFIRWRFQNWCQRKEFEMLFQGNLYCFGQKEGSHEIFLNDFRRYLTSTLSTNSRLDEEIIVFGLAWNYPKNNFNLTILVFSKINQFCLQGSKRLLLFHVKLTTITTIIKVFFDIEEQTAWREQSHKQKTKLEPLGSTSWIYFYSKIFERICIID